MKEETTPNIGHQQEAETQKFFWAGYHQQYLAKEPRRKSEVNN